MSDVSQNIGEYNSDSGLSFDIEIPDIPIPEPEEEVKSEVEDKVDVAFKFAFIVYFLAGHDCVFKIKVRLWRRVGWVIQQQGSKSVTESSVMCGHLRFVTAPTGGTHTSTSSFSASISYPPRSGSM